MCYMLTKKLNGDVELNENDDDGLNVIGNEHDKYGDDNNVVKIMNDNGLQSVPTETMNLIMHLVSSYMYYLAATYIGS